MIAWLAEQDWCDGNVGMWGTSYSGFNSLQIACERPPALKAICAIYASDDRWTDDVHWRGGALRLVDLVDYDHYMTPMSVLPPVPAVWGDGWRDEWRRRLETNEPWLLTWLRENRDGPYWRHGSLRSDGEAGYDRIECPVMLVAGWADGYRNNSFRTVAALREAGVPHRLLAGPWAHADPTTAYPGPRIDLDAEMVAWWDRWLRGSRLDAQDDRVERLRAHVDPAGARPRPARGLLGPRRLAVAGGVDRRPAPLDGPRSLAVEPDVGTSAWIDCAGHLPWGLSGDQREDDARSLTWEWPADGEVLSASRGSGCGSAPTRRLASLSVKLCDVFPDGTSALVTRGSLDLAFRDGVHRRPSRAAGARAGRTTSSSSSTPAPTRFEPGQTAPAVGGGGRLAQHDRSAGAGDPDRARRHARAAAATAEPACEPPPFAPGAATVLGGPGGRLLDHHPRRPARDHDLRGAARVDVRRPPRRHRLRGVRRRGRRGPTSPSPSTPRPTCTYRLTWPGIDVRVTSTMRVDVGAEGYDVAIDADGVRRRRAGVPPGVDRAGPALTWRVATCLCGCCDRSRGDDDGCIPHRKEHHERADDQCPADRADPRALDDRPKLGPLGGVLPGEGT